MEVNEYGVLLISLFFFFYNIHYVVNDDRNLLVIGWIGRKHFLIIKHYKYKILICNRSTISKWGGPASSCLKWCVLGVWWGCWRFKMLDHLRIGQAVYTPWKMLKSFLHKDGKQSKSVYWYIWRIRLWKINLKYLPEPMSNILPM